MACFLTKFLRNIEEITWKNEAITKLKKTLSICGIKIMLL